MAGGPAEIVIAVRADGNGAPQIDWGLPIELPRRVFDDLFHDPSTMVVPVIVRDGVVLHAPGTLDLGRSTRLANRAQRRALRAAHATCGVPGCEVGFDRCKVHHIIWWRHGGPTDLWNLTHRQSHRLRVSAGAVGLHSHSGPHAQLCPW